MSDITDPSYTKESTRPYKLGSNRLRYILGDVGIGKSAFIKKTLCEIEKNHLDTEEEFSILQVYINLEEHYDYGLQPKPLQDDFLLLLFNKIYDALDAKKALNFDRTKILSLVPNGDPVFCLKRLSAEIKKQNICLIIYIDNLDFYHYFYARYSYFPKYNKEQSKSIHENIMWLISVFSNGDLLGHLGFNVLFAARTYVYDEIVAKAAGINIEIDTTQAISISLPSEDIIISTRLDLMSQAIDKIVESKKGAQTSLNEYLSVLRTKMLSEKVSGKNFTAKPINTIHKLGQHGYRSLVHFLSSLNITYLDYELMDRFLDRQTTSLYFLYFNNMYRRYSQKQDHFPNMYLVDCTVMEGEGFEDAHESHQHSYLLKYFILKYIYKKKTVKFNEILDIFVDSGKYNDHVVRHVLGSLCTANEFRCAEQDHKQLSKNFNARKISVTDRGNVLFTKRHGVEFCLNFQYLETILDDQWLCIPNILFEEIYDAKSDYGHLYYKGAKYTNSSIKTMLRKSKKIMYFLHLLKACYSVEIEKNKPELHKVLKSNNLIPDWEYIQLNTILTTEALLKSFKRTETEEVKMLRKLLTELKTNNKISDAIEDYYSSGIEVSP